MKYEIIVKPKPKPESERQKDSPDNRVPTFRDDLRDYDRGYNWDHGHGGCHCPCEPYPHIPGPSGLY